MKWENKIDENCKIIDQQSRRFIYRERELCELNYHLMFISLFEKK